ncbi:hypothetical protein [uncultured Hyphomicrobium sp.]|uniref:hypothetical protein n=1 Tax=uncultured Hyphomicrobium sp. TaxID=194373 RepID=UPI0025EB970F|nr:hypothetical protein [uncultured Hyphomicrobium sp.]
MKWLASRQAALALAAAALLAAFGLARAADRTPAGLVEVKMGLESITKEQRTELWRRVDEYATVDALLDFCGKKLSLQKRTWAAVSPCVEVTSLRKVASVFRSKKAEYVKAWETAFADPEKKKTLCDSQKPKLAEYTRILDAHIAEARSMCDACLFC